MLAYLSTMRHAKRNRLIFLLLVKAGLRAKRWYRHLGFVGCSSHSGRRTFITNAARRISTVGGSLKDVQQLAGHSNLRTTQRISTRTRGHRCEW